MILGGFSVLVRETGDLSLRKSDARLPVRRVDFLVSCAIMRMTIISSPPDMPSLALAGLSFQGSEKSRDRMPEEPQKKRVVVFFDGQNLFHTAKAAFGYTFQNYDPLRLAGTICRSQGWSLQLVRFYIGV